MVLKFNAITGKLDLTETPAPGASAITDLEADDTNVASPSSGVVTIAGGTNIATTAASDTLTVSFDGTLPTGSGGTGLTGFTTGDLFYASDATTISKLAIGTANYVLTVSGGLPVWSAASSGDVTAGANIADNVIVRGDGGAKGIQGSGITISDTDDVSGAANVDLAVGGEYRINTTKVLDATSLGSAVVSSSLTSVGTIGTGVWQGTTVDEAYGGTGETTYTDGQILIGNTAGGLTKATITAGTGISIVNGNGTITISDSGTTGFSWTEVTGTTQAMAVENGYIANNASEVTFTLPTTAAIGDKVKVIGKGAGLYTIEQNAGETIYVVDTATTTGTGGSLTATEQYAAIELVCITANNDWVAMGLTGNFTVV